MNWQFQGFFAKVPTEVIEAALAQWPHCQGGVITEPFDGIGIALPPVSIDFFSPDFQEQVLQRYSVEEELPEWSRRYPETAFVYLDADCFSGVFCCKGYVCRDGMIIAKAKGDGALDRLFVHLGILFHEEETQPAFVRSLVSGGCVTANRLHRPMPRVAPLTTVGWQTK